MEISLSKITDVTHAHRAMAATMHEGFVAKAPLSEIYRWEHSLSRTQLFWIQVSNVPMFVQGHLTRHKIGVEWFCQSRRDDRSGEEGETITRLTPVNFAMLINAESLITMSRKRLCYKAHVETRQVLLQIKEVMNQVDPDLVPFLVPNCVYRGGTCPEPTPCGHYRVRRYYPQQEMGQCTPSAQHADFERWLAKHENFSTFRVVSDKRSYESDATEELWKKWIE